MLYTAKTGSLCTFYNSLKNIYKPETLIVARPRLRGLACHSGIRSIYRRSRLLILYGIVN